MAASRGYGCYACVCGIFLVILGFGLGFIIGYFVLKQPVYVTSVADEGRLSIYEDLDFLVDTVNLTDYAELDEKFEKFNEAKPSEKNISLFIHQTFKEFGLDRVELQHRKFLITPPDGDLLNQLKVIDSSGQVFFQTNFSDVKQNYSGVHCPLSKIREETVFVNHAESSDFRLLQQNKVNLEYKIFVARCGNIHLDNMIKNSQEHGARGLLYYIDPKNPPLYEHMCRSTSNIFLLTEEDPEKAMISSAVRVLVQQISYEDVEKLFKADPKAPVGASICVNCKAELEIKSAPREQELFNVIGKIRGQLEPDRYIIVGSHRSYTKTNSGLDTGTKTLLQLLATFHTLKKQGWLPKRTLIFTSFSGRNYGNLGAIKWLHENYDELLGNAVAYINVGSYKNSQHQIESSSSATTALFSAMHKAKMITGKFTEHGEDFTNRSVLLSGYTDTTPIAYYMGIPAVNFNFGEVCGDNFRLSQNKTIMGPCGYIAMSLALEFSDSDLIPLNLKYLVAQLSHSFETLFSFDSKYKNELHKQGINLGELRNSIKDFDEMVRSFYESDIVRNYLLRRVVNDVVTKVLHLFISKKEIVKPLFRNKIFLPEASNLLKVSAFQGIVNLVELVEEDSSAANAEALKNHFKDVVSSLDEACKLLEDILSM